MDIGKLKKLLGNDEKMVAQFLDIFKKETPKQLSELRRAIENKNWDSASNIAHGIKSQVKYLDLKAIAEMAYEIENCAEKKENTERLPVYYEEMEGALSKVIEAL